MKTKQDYINQALAANPKPVFFNANGVMIELSEAEYDAMIENWAQMRFWQDNPDQQPPAAPFGV